MKIWTSYITSRCAAPAEQTPEYTREAAELFLCPVSGLFQIVKSQNRRNRLQGIADFKFSEDKMEFVFDREQ